jgi:hypothetical protein
VLWFSLSENPTQLGASPYNPNNGIFTMQDTLNPNNPANYKPLIVSWEIQGKHGKGWINLGVFCARGDLQACRKCYKLHRYQIMRVRAIELGIIDKWHIIKFKKPTN